MVNKWHRNIKTLKKEFTRYFLITTLFKKILHACEKGVKIRD